MSENDEVFQTIVLIHLERIYDIGLALLSCFNPDKAVALAAAHERGETFGPPPAKRWDDE